MRFIKICISKLNSEITISLEMEMKFEEVDNV